MAASHAQKAEQSQAHVIISDNVDEENDDWAQAARAEAESARVEALQQHPVLAKVQVADAENAGQTVEFAIIEPYKAIRSRQDLERFKQSTSYRLVKDFVLALNDSCKGKKTRDEARKVSEACEKVVAVLRKMNAWVDEIPPIDQPMRYGNKAFRSSPRPPSFVTSPMRCIPKFQLTKRRMG